MRRASARSTRLENDHRADALFAAVAAITIASCGSPAASGGKALGIGQLGSLCSPDLARLSRSSEPVHDVIRVIYRGLGSLHIETFDHNLKPLASRLERFTRPDGDGYDTFSIPLTGGVVVQAARLTMSTPSGSRHA